MPLKCSNNNAFATLRCLKNASMNHKEKPAPTKGGEVLDNNTIENTHRSALGLQYFYSRIVHTGNARNVEEKYVLFAALSPHFGRATCTVFCWIPRLEYTLHISFPMSRSYILCEFYFFFLP